MIILAVETSCDDTGIALLKKDKGKVETIASVVSSQNEVHEKWGGVYPSEAKREHQKNLIPALTGVLKKSNFLEEGETPEHPEIENILWRETTLLSNLKDFLKKYRVKKIDAIAVTVGPGLDPCLWVGVNFARAFSLCLDLPIVPVNHIKAHISFFLFSDKNVAFPVVTLIASGGHTELVLMKDINSYQVLGRTRDDAAGECFDKSARVLGLGYPGGPKIAAEAAKFSISNSQFSIKLPRPMKYSDDYDFSFSGLKTAVLYDYRSRDKETQQNKEYIALMAKEVEESVTDVLIFKLEKAVKEHNAKTVIIGGGVTANKTLQEKAKEMTLKFEGVELLTPSVNLATDNAEMIGATAFMSKERKNYKEVEAKPNLKISDN
ncbi:MAG: tRNA (adenosine(37)-N6)-threonylcarbamoyltransferase complex transferase subunit TsaD [Candidatus Pacebacteria bacterium]|nr:tRNA (adenosine(37)-N6)-threonylcarbamoyltransferase complex transferase subunit TsaD [Candidatus Paceibacterota bacterium]